MAGYNDLSNELKDMVLRGMISDDPYLTFLDYSSLMRIDKRNLVSVRGNGFAEELKELHELATLLTKALYSSSEFSDHGVLPLDYEEEPILNFLSTETLAARVPATLAANDPDRKSILWSVLEEPRSDRRPALLQVARELLHPLDYTEILPSGGGLAEMPEEKRSREVLRVMGLADTPARSRMIVRISQRMDLVPIPLRHLLVAAALALNPPYGARAAISIARHMEYVDRADRSSLVAEVSVAPSETQPHLIAAVARGLRHLDAAGEDGALLVAHLLRLSDPNDVLTAADGLIGELEYLKVEDRSRLVGKVLRQANPLIRARLIGHLGDKLGDLLPKEAVKLVDAALAPAMTETGKAVAIRGLASGLYHFEPKDRSRLVASAFGIGDPIAKSEALGGLARYSIHLKPEESKAVLQAICELLTNGFTINNAYQDAAAGIAARWKLLHERGRGRDRERSASRA